MNDDIRWLVRLGIEQGLFTRQQCLEIKGKLGREADFMAFAQEFIDRGIVTDVERLETLAGLAMAKVGGDTLTSDPFGEPRPSVARLSLRASSTTANGDGEHFDFETMASLDETALAIAMRGLLKSTAAQGASDLHLSTGARPFIRRNRVLSFISNHTLSAEDALRANTVLLSEGQKKIFL